MTEKKASRFNNASIAFSHKSDAELGVAQMVFSMLSRPALSKALIRLARLALLLRAPITPLIKKTFFAYFCGGETLEECESVIQKLYERNVKTVLDYSVEGGRSETDFDNTQNETLRMLNFAHGDDRIPFCVFKITGLADAQLMERKQAGETLTPDETERLLQAEQRLGAICAKANEYQLPILIDAEGSQFQDEIDRMAYKMMERHNREKPLVFNTLQMYRTDGPARLLEAYERAVANGYWLGIKMVRGAYMEEERRWAVKNSVESPIWPSKEATDKAFDEGLAFCLEHIDKVALACGSHNDQSNFYLTQLMEERGLTPHDSRIWFIQLYGMNDIVSFNLAANGYNVAKYVPYGPTASVVPYLIRRAEENSSVVGQSGRELRLIQEERRRRKMRSAVRAKTSAIEGDLPHAH